MSLTQHGLIQALLDSLGRSPRLDRVVVAHASQARDQTVAWGSRDGDAGVLTVRVPVVASGLPSAKDLLMAAGAPEDVVWAAVIGTDGGGVVGETLLVYRGKPASFDATRCRKDAVGSPSYWGPVPSEMLSPSVVGVQAVTASAFATKTGFGSDGDWFVDGTGYAAVELVLGTWTDIDRIVGALRRPGATLYSTRRAFYQYAGTTQQNGWQLVASDTTNLRSGDRLVFVGTGMWRFRRGAANAGDATNQIEASLLSEVPQDLVSLLQNGSAINAAFPATRSVLVGRRDDTSNSGQDLSVDNVGNYGGLNVTDGGKNVTAVASTPFAVRSGNARVCKFQVDSVPGSPQDLLFYDNASAASGTVLLRIPSTATVGQVFAFNPRAALGIYAAANANTVQGRLTWTGS